MRLGSPIKCRSQRTFERHLPLFIKWHSWQQSAMANMVLFSSLCTKSSLLSSSHRLSYFFEHFLAITMTILSLLLSFRFHYYFVHPNQVSSSSQRASHPSASTSLRHQGELPPSAMSPAQAQVLQLSLC